MPRGLSLNDAVRVTINLSPKAAAYRNFGALLCLGPSDVIDTSEALREYTGIEAVASDFGINTPEYLFAAYFFAQEPKPAILYIGRWADTATHGRMMGRVLSGTERAMSSFTSVAAGSFHVSIDGSAHDITGIDLTGETNLNGVASAIQTALRAVGTGGYSLATCVWDGTSHRFIIRSGTTGASSTVSKLTAAGSGTALAATLGMDTNSGYTVVGIDAEEPVAAAARLADKSSKWYGLAFAPGNVEPTVEQLLAVSQYIEAEGDTKSRIFGVTITDSDILDSENTTDFASQAKASNYKRTFSMYSTSSPYAIASLIGRAFTVDFKANNSTITLKFKQAPGLAAEDITESQRQVLLAKNCNFFGQYEEDVAIIEPGVMANGYWFDEVHGTDWFQNEAQIDVFNLLYQSPTKIPQTDDGTHQIVTVLEKTCDKAVNNGLVSEGVWNVQGFGQLKFGQTLTKGYYIYAPLVASQSPADREARHSVPIQVALKLGGAIHDVNVLVTVNR